MSISENFTTPLVGTSWLESHLNDSDLRIVDASWYMPSSGRNAQEEYEAAHIPGAVFASIDWLSDETAPYPHTLPTPDVLSKKLGSLGLGNEHSIVVYDGSAKLFSAARIWYMIRSLGHKRVAVLDGGIARWKAEGKSVTKGIESYPPAKFAAHADPKFWRNLSQMKANLASTQETVVDARSPSRFNASEAEPRAGVRGGHIPNARNVHYATLTNSNGSLLSPDQLRSRFAESGVDIQKPVVCSCGSGVTACVVALGLELAGAKQVAVYDGSWTEWGSQPDTPVQTGPAV